MCSWGLVAPTFKNVIMNDKIFFRPKTRGELAQKIIEGIPCEVVSSNREITTMILDGWLGMRNKYYVSLSQNKGWDIYRNTSKLKDDI